MGWGCVSLSELLIGLGGSGMVNGDFMMYM